MTGQVFTRRGVVAALALEAAWAAFAAWVAVDAADAGFGFRDIVVTAMDVWAEPALAILAVTWLVERAVAGSAR